MIVQILFGLTVGICLLITVSACLVKNVSGKTSKREAWNDDPPSYDSIDFSKSELPTYDDIRDL